MREIVKLINYSPKRKHLFSEKHFDSEGPSTTGIKPLCPTRWTARTAAIEAVINHYSVIIDRMEDINLNTHDEYGLKAGGVLSALEKFETFFSLRLCYLLFGCAENTSKVLQAKDISVQEAVSAVKVTQSFYQRQRQDEYFEKFFESTITDARALNIGEPVLPRFRRPPQRFDGDTQHEFRHPRELFRKQYFEALDLLIQELHDRFEQKEIMQPVLSMESLLLKSANGERHAVELEQFTASVFKDDLSIEKLDRELAILVDVINVELPKVKRVTSIRTICEAMRAHANRQMLSEVHKLLRQFQ